MSGRAPYYNNQNPYLQGNPNPPPTTTSGQQYGNLYGHTTYPNPSDTHLSPNYSVCGPTMFLLLA